MTPTSVGMRCPECSKQKTKVHTIRSMATEPRVTYALIAINVVMFLATGSFSVGDGQGGTSLSFDLALLGHVDGTFGSVPGVGVAEGEYWRLVTGGFLHANLLHIFFNMYLLYMLGPQLEAALGNVRFAALYIAALLAGSAGALIVTPDIPTVGASGAVFGLMGAMVIEQRARGMDPFEGGIFGSIGGLIVINLIFSFFVSGISIGGHIGGLVGGTIAAWLMSEAVRRRMPSYAPLLACGLVSVVSIGIAIAAAGGSGIG
ncbi:MAG TPA: rhomboid family intramembrane serine protease [Solirubrobacteraceae bacterium]|nr:rhomboid family intramembrane serine protease [Solirubrobacteraceae bacterium]